MLLVVGRDDVTVEVALRGISTPLAVTEWRRLPAKVRQALPTAEDLSATVTRTVREIESAAGAAWPHAVISDMGIRAERAWALPYHLRKRLGFLTPRDLAARPASVRAAVQQEPTWLGSS